MILCWVSSIARAAQASMADVAQQPNANEGRNLQGNPLIVYEVISQMTSFLSLLGFYSSYRVILPHIIFFLLGGVVPALMVVCGSSCSEYFSELEMKIFISQSLLAFATLSCFYSQSTDIGNILFSDDNEGDMAQFDVKLIKGFFSSLRIWLLLCLLLKIVHESICFSYMEHAARWEYIIVRAIMFISWTYLTAVFVSSFLLFKVACNLKTIQLTNCKMLLQDNLQIVLFLNKHKKMIEDISKISQIFDRYLLFAFLIVTVCQFMIVSQITEWHGMFNVVNDGVCVVTLIIEVGGVIICFDSAIRISAGIRQIESAAKEWHASLTNRSAENNLTMQAASTFEERRAFVKYLEYNKGGIAVCGMMVDGAFIKTLVFNEFLLLLILIVKLMVVRVVNALLTTNHINIWLMKDDAGHIQQYHRLYRHGDEL